MKVVLTVNSSRSHIAMTSYELRLFGFGGTISLQLTAKSGPGREDPNNVVKLELPENVAMRIAYSLLAATTSTSASASDDEIRFAVDEPE